MKKWKSTLATGIIGAMCICGCSTGQDDNPESKTDYTSGKPWLCSVMEGNVTEDMPTDLKDDFYLAVNKDDIINLEFAPGESSTGFIYRGGKTKQKRI